MQAGRAPACSSAPCQALLAGPWSRCSPQALQPHQRCKVCVGRAMLSCNGHRGPWSTLAVAVFQGTPWQHSPGKGHNRAIWGSWSGIWAARGSTACVYMCKAGSAACKNTPREKVSTEIRLKENVIKHIASCLLLNFPCITLGTRCLHRWLLCCQSHLLGTCWKNCQVSTELIAQASFLVVRLKSRREKLLRGLVATQTSL